MSGDDADDCRESFFFFLFFGLKERSDECGVREWEEDRVEIRILEMEWMDKEEKRPEPPALLLASILYLSLSSLFVFLRFYDMVHCFSQGLEAVILCFSVNCYFFRFQFSIRPFWFLSNYERPLVERGNYKFNIVNDKIKYFFDKKK